MCPRFAIWKGVKVLSRLDIMTPSRAQTVIDGLYRDVERRIAASPPGLCPVDMSLSFLQLCHAQTCGKCVPCRIGLGQLTLLINQVLDGEATMETIAIIEKTARSIVNTADCAIGRDAARLVVEGLEGFRDDYEEHVKHNRCLACLQNPVPCVALCPAGVDIPGYMALVGEGRCADAVRLIRKDNPFPTACAYICEHPCEARCRRNMVDDAINIRGLKRYAVDHAGVVPQPECAPATGKKVAIIGGGPSGLSCAYYLALMGHGVTVYEEREQLGGMLRYGIPSYRFPREKLDAEIESILSLGIEVHTGVTVGRDIWLEKLEQEYDCIYIAIGAHQDKKTGIPGENSKNVISAVEMLRAIGDNEMPDFTGKQVVVIGGGNVAMDVCRSAVRLGADETYVLYRRSEAELPADPEEVKEAMEEGVQFRFLTAPVEILGENDKVTGIRAERMALGEPDEKGRRKPVGTGEFETLAVDSVIGAIGQTVDWGTLDVGALTTTKKGTAEADALTYQTAQPDIFVGGDCYTGPKFAIDAIAAGKEAAISLHRYVHPGQTLTGGRDRRVYKALDKEHVLIETADFDKDHRQMPGYNAAKAKTFTDARVTFTEEQVRRECARCLGCGATKVDSYLCIGCGLCTTKCKFDAIHLKKVRDWHAGSYETMPIKVAEGVVKRAGSIVKKAVSK